MTGIKQFKTIEDFLKACEWSYDFDQFIKRPVVTKFFELRYGKKHVGILNLDYMTYYIDNAPIRSHVEIEIIINYDKVSKAMLCVFGINPDELSQYNLKLFMLGDER